ncbi:MAG: hypothetical protein AVDCRST_MAG19-3273, partial [uncultured Thermomicrobiales bacterium]
CATSRSSCPSPVASSADRALPRSTPPRASRSAPTPRR